MDKIHNDIVKIDDYQNAALRTANKDLTKMEMVTNGLMGLNGEAGEALDILKKHLFQGHDFDREHVAKELGDIAWYLALTANALGYNLSDILNANVNKLAKRYPDGFDADKSVNRAKEDI